MQNTTVGESDQFFGRGRWLPIPAGIVACGNVLLAFVNLLWGDVLHIINACVQFVLALLLGWLAWRWWKNSRFPAITVSDEAIGWRAVLSRQPENILTRDVLELIPPVGLSATPLGLQTRSRGTVWISLDALSVDDRHKVCRAIETRLPPVQDCS